MKAPSVSKELLKRINAGREHPGRYQVRFWTSPDLYADFTAKCDKIGINYQHAFNEFLKWYVDSPACAEREGEKP